MKKFFFLITTLFFLGQLTYGQDQLVTDTTVSTKKVKKTTAFSSLNLVKINLLNLPLRNYSFQYERVLSKRLSIALGYRTMPSGGIPYLSTIESAADITDPDVLDVLRSVQFQNVAITPELRIYLGKKGYGRGFYVAPYYRYLDMNFKTSSAVEVTFDDKSTRDVNVTAQIKLHNIGMMLGAQWMLSKYVALDWWIIGGQVGFHQAELKGVPTTDFSQGQLDEIQNKIQVNFKNLGQTSLIQSNNVSMKTKAFIPATGLRTGLCLGVRF